MKTNKTGFGLVELLVVIGMLMSLLAIVIGIHEFRLHRAAQREKETEAKAEQVPLTPEQLENRRLVELEEQQVAEQQAKAAAEQAEAKRLADLEQQKVAAEQAMEAKVNQVQNCGHGAYYFPFADMGEFLSVRNAFMDKYPSMKFQATEQHVITYEAGRTYSYSYTVGHVIYFKEE